MKRVVGVSTLILCVAVLSVGAAVTRAGAQESQDAMRAAAIAAKEDRKAMRQMEREAMCAKTAGEFEQKSEALSAVGKPYKWEAAFKIAKAGVVTNADEFTTMEKCLTHMEKRVFSPLKGSKTRECGSSCLRDRLLQVEAAVPATSAWLYDERCLWKRLVWKKAVAGDESYMEVLANAAQKGVMMNTYADIVCRFAKATSVEDFEQIKASCQRILDSPGILGSNPPEEEYALFSTVLAMQACKKQAALSVPADSEKYLNEAKQWAQRVKNFGGSAFDKEAETVLGRRGGLSLAKGE